MTAYCIVSDVEALERQRLKLSVYTNYSAGPPIVVASIPSLADVEKFCENIYDEINQTILRAGYQIPIATNNYLIRCNAMGAAWQIEMVLNVSGTLEAMKAMETREKAYKEMLQSIKENPRISGAIPAAGGANNIVLSDGTSHWTNPKVIFHSDLRDW